MFKLSCTHPAGNYYIASTPSTNTSIPQWVLSSKSFGTKPGSSAGLIFGLGDTSCPTSVVNWMFYHQTDKQTVEDDTMTALCRKSKAPYYPGYILSDYVA